jgi:hypothetical protein
MACEGKKDHQSGLGVFREVELLWTYAVSSRINLVQVVSKIDLVPSQSCQFFPKVNQFNLILL